MTAPLTLVSSQPNPQGDGDDLYPQTAESIAAARAAQLAERRQMTLDTGIRISDEGTLIDEVALGLKLGNWMASALFGSRGELRTRKGQ